MLVYSCLQIVSNLLHSVLLPLSNTAAYTCETVFYCPPLLKVSTLFHLWCSGPLQQLKTMDSTLFYPLDTSRTLTLVPCASPVGGKRKDYHFNKKLIRPFVGLSVGLPVQDDESCWRLLLWEAQDNGLTGLQVSFLETGHNQSQRFFDLHLLDLHLRPYLTNENSRSLFSLLPDRAMWSSGILRLFTPGSPSLELINGFLQKCSSFLRSATTFFWLCISALSRLCQELLMYSV